MGTTFDIHMNEKGFRYFYIYNKDRPKKVWLGKEVLKEAKEIKFPLKNHKIIQTKKGNWVIIPEKRTNLFLVTVSCCYRGYGKIKEIEGIKNEKLNFLWFYYYSPRGSLGIDEKCFFNSNKEKIKYKVKSTGRNCDGNIEAKEMDIEGGIVTLPDDEELEELL